MLEVDNEGGSHLILTTAGAWLWHLSGAVPLVCARGQRQAKPIVQLTVKRAAPTTEVGRINQNAICVTITAAWRAIALAG